jgi:peroxin-1
MDPQLGLAIGLVDGQKIMVEFCRNVPECSTVSVEPLTEDDWEILELHAGYVEENLLSQLRVVYTNQVFCVWIHGKTLVKLVVSGDLDPKGEFAKLTNMSEVIVAPKVRNKKKDVEESNNFGGDTEQVIKKSQPCIGLRVCPNQELDELCIKVHPDSIHALGNTVPERIRLSKLVPAYNNNNKKEENGGEDVLVNGIGEESLAAKAIFANLILSKDVPLRHVAIGSILKHTLEIKDFDIVK